MSSTRRILIGLGTGVAVGIFLGERAAVFSVAAEVFVKLLQMTVLPYVTVSIVTSLGSLDHAQARTLGLRAGAVLCGLWAVALVFTFLIPLTFPTMATASFFSTTLLERRAPFDFVGLYIPSNPFNSLANNVVPAVVLFSVILGVALIGVPRKQTLLDVLRVAGDAVSRATRLAVRLTPYGLFAIAASAAGTLNVDQLERLQVYLVAYVGVGLLVSLWVLPGLIAALTPIKVADIFRLTRDALVTAVVAGDLFIVLPVLTEASRTLLERHTPEQRHAASLPDIIVPASFNFPHTGKLLSISFVLFAGWFADAAVSVRDYPWLALTGLLTFFGSLNAAVPFLLDLFRIPADTFQLFLATGVINARIGTLVAAMHTLAVALIGASAISGTLRFDRKALLRYALITAALTLAVVGTTRAVFAGILRPEYTRDKVLAGMHLLHEPVTAVVHRTAPPPAPHDSRPILERVRADGVLRVGYVPDALPFVFVNSRGDLVGFDVELAHRLARELGVRLEFLPLDRADLERQVAAGYCDLVMSGLPVTTVRASRMLFSQPYLDETFALVVRDGDREAFSSWQAIRARPSTTIAVPDVPYYIDKIRQQLPGATLRVVQDAATIFGPDAPVVDAVVMPAERGSAWTLLYPQYAVVVPEPGVVKVPLAYPVCGGDQAFASFLNTWIDLKRKDGTLDRLYAYWVLGRDAAPRPPRWSIIRDVLHWVD
jgi:Na+/H+-dicarboxylate symporter/ABC-type amino acid transport substrate-binding protein